MLNIVERFLRDEDGSVGTEYVVLVALIGAAIIASITDIGKALDGAMSAYSDAVKDIGPV